MLGMIDQQGLTAGVISDKTQQVLQDHEINEDGPGTILRDFETLLDFIGTDGLKTSGKYFFLPQRELNELNSRMSHPMPHQLKRPQQRSFPRLHGLYLMLRASGMATGVGTPPNGRLVLDQETVAAWRALNPTERYFALLESWLVEGSPEILAERDGWHSSCARDLFELAQRLTARRTEGDACRGGVLYNTMTLMTAALMELFGWIRLEYDKTESGKGAQVAAVERLAWGDAMVNALYASDLRRVGLLDEESISEGKLLQPLFQPYFPQFQKTLTQREFPYQDGTFVWRVSLGKVWRRIAAPDDSSLDDLAMAILTAFEFDDDHLYCFTLCHPNGRTLRIACPHEQDATVFTDEMALGELLMAEGGTMTMTYDCGDCWEFNIALEKIGPSAETEAPQVIAMKGEAPPQYDWEDDWADDL